MSFLRDCFCQVIRFKKVYPADLWTFASCIAVPGMATHSSKKHKLLGAPAPLDTGARVFARLPAEEHWL